MLILFDSIIYGLIFTILLLFAIGGPISVISIYIENKKYGYKAPLIPENPILALLMWILSIIGIFLIVVPKFIDK